MYVIVKNKKRKSSYSKAHLAYKALNIPRVQFNSNSHNTCHIQIFPFFFKIINSSHPWNPFSCTINGDYIVLYTPWIFLKYKFCSFIIFKKKKKIFINPTQKTKYSYYYSIWIFKTMLKKKSCVNLLVHVDKTFLEFLYFFFFSSKNFLIFFGYI